jgi:GT2 family glycosyltransferase
MRKDVAVLLVNWSTVHEFERCLDTLREYEGEVPLYVRQNHKSQEISDRCVEVAKSYGATISVDEENLGHGLGINTLAIEAKRFRYFFIVNPDCAWTEPIFDRLVEFLRADRNRCIVGPKQMDSQNRITAGGIFGTMEQPVHRMWREHDPGNVKARDTREAIVVAGSAMMIRNSDFFSYGKMLPSNHYYSETFLCYHTLHHGRTNWYYGEPWMIHEWHRSSPLGFEGSDGKFKEDRAFFRQMCDTHDPPIPHD